MELDAWLTLAIVTGVVVALVRDLLPAAAAVLAGSATLLVLGVIDAEQAFAGFANPAPITVAALYVLAGAVESTGALTPVVNAIMGDGRPRESFWGRRRPVARVAVPTLAASSVLNNTPIVAMAAPQIADWATKRRLPVSPLLMPLSFAAILGGLVTAIGTSTNIVVSGLMDQVGMGSMGMFEISRVGVPVAVLGAMVLVVLAPRLLPHRRTAMESFDESVRQFTMAMRVAAEGPLEGKTVADAGLRDLQGVYLVQVERRGDGQVEVIAPVPPTQLLRGGDLLTFVGKVDLVVDLQRMRGLESTESAHTAGLDRTGHTFFEAVIGPDSLLAGRTLKEVGFRSRYGAAVLAVHRAGDRVDAKLGQVRLRAGDTLLVLADEGFRERWRDTQDFLLVAKLGGAPPARSRKAPLVGVLTLLLLGLAGTGALPILEASLVVAGLLIATGAIGLSEARESIDLDVIVTIAAAFGLGAAVEASGLADDLAIALVSALDDWGPIGALVAVLVSTTLLTELITNNAAAVLMFPLALSTAAAVGADPRPFAFAVAVAASASFLTPIGYQTNTMVYGIGGYRFGDFVRLGLPITVLVWITAALVIPLAWPL